MFPYFISFNSLFVWNTYWSEWFAETSCFFRIKIFFVFPSDGCLFLSPVYYLPYQLSNFVVSIAFWILSLDVIQFFFACNVQKYSYLLIRYILYLYFSILYWSCLRLHIILVNFELCFYDFPTVFWIIQDNKVIE